MRSDGERLLDLAAADQNDRRQARYEGLAERDRVRRAEVLLIVQRAAVLSGEQLAAAALVLQHSDQLADIERAHELAGLARTRGVDLAASLVAMTADRAAMFRGQPQPYGTQMAPDVGGWRLWDVDPRTSDAERAAIGLASLEELRAAVGRVTDGIPVPPENEDLPSWLSDARRRWRAEAAAP